MFGNVYVFNEDILNITAFNLNDQGSTGMIEGLSEETTPPYQPYQLVVARTNLDREQLTSPLFVEGPNDVLIGLEGGYIRDFTITIPPPSQAPLESDLLLHIYGGKAILLNIVGNILEEVEIQLVKG